jgi:hypothetical protein
MSLRYSYQLSISTRSCIEASHRIHGNILDRFQPDGNATIRASSTNIIPAKAGMMFNARHYWFETGFRVRPGMTRFIVFSGQRSGFLPDYLITVTFTEADDVLPAISLATARMVCVPARTFFGRVFQLYPNVLPFPVALSVPSM